jgi:hypothetical protein
MNFDESIDSHQHFSLLKHSQLQQQARNHSNYDKQTNHDSNSSKARKQPSQPRTIQLFARRSTNASRPNRKVFENKWLKRNFHEEITINHSDTEATTSSLRQQQQKIERRNASRNFLLNYRKCSSPAEAFRFLNFRRSDSALLAPTTPKAPFAPERKFKL